MTNTIKAYRAFLNEVTRLVEIITTRLYLEDRVSIGNYEFWDNSDRSAQRLLVMNKETGEILELNDEDHLLLWEDLVIRALEAWES